MQAYNGSNTANDAWTEKGGSSWSTVRGNSSSDVVHNANDGYNGYHRVTGQKWMGNYYIQRLHLVFNTSSLATSTTIGYANIVFNIGDGNFTSSSTSLYLVGSAQGGNYATTGDYSQVGGVDFGHIAVPSTGVYTINLNQDGIDSVGLATSTKFAARSWHDFNDIVPLQEVGSGNEGDDLYIVSAEGNVSNAPTLTVNYW
jgi:hypothetical protein